MRPGLAHRSPFPVEKTFAVEQTTGSACLRPQVPSFKEEIWHCINVVLVNQ